MNSVPLAPDRPGEAFPASAAQQRLWFLQHRHPDSRAYTVTEAIRLRGPVDPAALERALAALVGRHRQLRAVFEYRDGALWQRVLPIGTHPLRLRCDTVARDDLDRWLVGLARPAFDLRDGPPVRAALAEVGPDERVLALLVHHIVTDGSAAGVFFEELGEAYRAELAGRRPEWTAPAGDYRAVVEDERRRLAAPGFADRVAAAARPLRGVPVTLDLPVDRPVTEPARAGTVRRLLDPDLVAGVGAAAAAAGVTPAMFHAAAFAALLARHTGRSSVVIGLPAAGREHPDLARVHGLLVNTLALPVEVRADDTWSGLLERVRDAALAAYAYADVPFDRLAAALGGAPLQAMLVVQPDEEPLPRLPGVSAARYFPANLHTKFDVVLQIDRALAVPPGGTEPRQGVWVALEYPADSWDPGRAERMLAHWHLVVAAMTATPAAPVSDLDLATPEEVALRAGLRRRAQAPPPLDPVAGFAAVAAERPGAPAVRHRGTTVTYDALARRVGAVQTALLRAGVRPGDSVGVCLRRTPDLVAALYAVLRCGAAYVPLDPGYPRERLAFIAEDSDCALVLVQPDTVGTAGPGTPTLDVTALPDAPPPTAVPVEPERVAYLIYTSGSTGRPKGVAIPHRALRAFLGWARDAFPAEDLRVVLASTSVCFDLSVFELFLPLSLGGSVRLVDTVLELAEQADPAPSLVNTVPSAMAELLRAGALPAGTRVVNLAGEVLPRALVDAVHAGSTSVRVRNLYGPSEDTTYSTWCEVPRGDSREPTIGRPVDGTDAYVLDAGLAPVPVGVDGELFLGGLGVAQGYLARPALTAERFLPDPFGGSPGARMYRTGDRVRLTPTGELRYLGRYDDQVKLRGFRIETGEIESRAAALPGVEQAVVVVRPVAGTEHLVCYWTGAADRDTLRAGLAAVLPEHMLPRFWVPSETLPRTPNGKVDRARLPEPARDTPGGAEPATDTERELAEQVARITASGPLGPDADFFALGGHSLTAMQLVAAVRERTDVELNLADVFACRTVRALADRVDRLAARPAAPPALRARPDAGPAPLAHAQERMWLVEQLRPGTAVLNIGLAVRWTGPLDHDLLRRAVQALTDRHDALRLRVGRDDDGVLRQRAVAVQPVTLHRLSARTPAETDRLLRATAATPFDVATEPPARWVSIDEPPTADGAARTVLGLVIHHVVADAWSLRVLLEELSADYAALRRQDPVAPAPAVSVLDHGHWQRHQLELTTTVRRDLAYWRERLADLPDRLRLPFDHEPRTATSYRGARLTRRLPTAAVTALLSVGRAAGATDFTALLALYQGLLGRLSGQDDVVVGTPVAQRDQPGTERLVGCLLNTVALRADLTGRPSYAALLEQAVRRCREAFEHQRAPFELVLGASEPRRTVEHTPVFQTMFVLHGAQPPLVGPPGLTCSPVEVEPVATQFDVTLMISPDGDGWVAEWDYRTDLFRPETVERFADCFDRMLAAAADRPTAPLAHLPLCPPEQAARLLAAGRPAGPPVPATLPELFAARVAADPDAPAVRDDTGTLTYRQLDAAADRLARRLAGRGVGREDLVALVLPRSAAAVVAVLAVSRAGAAFLCLDPALAAERMEWIARDAGVRLQLTDAALSGRLDRRLVPELRVDLARPGEPTARPDVDGLTPEHLCYAVYTSGSTGTPKGVLLPHRGLAQLRELHRDRLDAGPGAHVLQYAPHSFDAWVWEYVLGLLTGACLHLTAPDALLPGPPLSAVLEARGITHLTMPPSNLAMVPTLPGSLRHLVLAGEALPAELVGRWGGTVHLWNAYGPTEATVCGTVRDCGDLPADRAPTIGTPFPGAQAYVLDDGLNPVPPGVPGELCLGGQGLGRGYLGRPALTAEKFVPHPDPAVPGERLYRTGDRARLTAAGEIEFLGRADDQVKLRGVRVELGEVEAALAAADPRVTGAVALVLGSGGDQHLVGVVAGPAGVDPVAVRDRLAATLPGYLVPARVERLESFPLTGNGKLDRRALAASVGTRRPGPSRAAPPRGPVEQEVAAIWRELLPAAEIGRDDSFFAAGGTSLTLARLHERLDARYSGSLKLVDLFRLTTVAAIATALEDAGAVTPAAAADLSFRL